MDETIRTVAHDFNHFLTAIIGSVQLALEELPADAPVVDDLQLALDSAYRAAELTRSLVVPDGQREVGRRTADLVEIVRSADEILRRTAGGENRLELELPEHPVPVHVDAGSVERVLLNLIANSRDAIDGAGEILVAVRVADGAAGGEAVIEVSDDGAGISEAAREEVFAPSFTTKGSGTGLGLAIVRRVMEEAGGAVEVESEAGAGATFRARLPLSDGRYDRPEGEQRRPDPRKRGDRVLIVMEEQAARSVVAEALKRRGYRTYSARALDGGLELLDTMEGPPGLLVTDLVIDDPWGFEVAQALRERRPDAAVLFVSGDPLRALSEHGPKIEREALLGRPFSIGELVSAVRGAVEGRRPATGGAGEGA